MTDPQRRRAVRRRRLVAGATTLAAALGVVAVTVGHESVRHHATSASASRTAAVSAPATQSASGAPDAPGARGAPGAPAAPKPKPKPKPPFAVGMKTLRLVDASRRIRLPDGTSEPRTLVTYVRYPTAGGPFPLVVFGHGYTLEPRPYARLLDAWARAGYVVAAPVFPLENANAPGGPDESDLIHQPRDMSFVITRVLAASAAPRGRLSHLIDPSRVAVAGHSDGGETALAVAYDEHFLDRRVKASMILSGAKIPGVGGFTFPPGSPPLLATQGTADTINPPDFTYSFYDLARRPKFLLKLLGASHLGPYTDQQPQRGIVERVTLAFLNRYLRGDLAAGRRLEALGTVAGIAALRAEP